MKKIILVLVAVIVAATEISSATEISRECKSREYTYITQSYNTKEKLILRIVEEVLRGSCFADTSYLVRVKRRAWSSDGTTYNYKVKTLDKDIQGIYENSRELIITESEYSSYRVHVDIEYSSPSFYYRSDDQLEAHVPVTSIIVELPFGADPNSRELTITMSEDKSYYLVHVDEIIENSSIFIYTIDGNLCCYTPVTSNTVKLSRNLLKGETWVVNYFSNDKMKRKKYDIGGLWCELYLKVYLNNKLYPNL